MTLRIFCAVGYDDRRMVLDGEFTYESENQRALPFNVNINEISEEMKVYSGSTSESSQITFTAWSHILQHNNLLLYQQFFLFLPRWPKWALPAIVWKLLMRRALPAITVVWPRWPVWALPAIPAIRPGWPLWALPAILLQVMLMAVWWALPALTAV